MAAALKANTVDGDELAQHPVPVVDGTKYLLNGEILSWTGKTSEVTSPVVHAGKRITLGVTPLFDAATSLAALKSCDDAWAFGRGVWPTMPAAARCEVVERFCRGLAARQKEIALLLSWEVCKPLPEAEKEVERTIVYCRDTVAMFKKMENEASTFVQSEGVFAQVRRAPFGVSLVMGPFNYPLNECYCLLIPAVLCGNTVVLKVPRTGGLCHLPTLELLRECFPAGVVNTIFGSGRDTIPPLMASGKVSLFAFIGSSRAADELQKAHPAPHKLRVCLGLDAKNPAILLPSADLSLAVAECVTGALSFNGQRCTALKILFVHESLVDRFVPLLSAAVDALPLGPPWRTGVKITPLPETGKIEWLTNIINDATAGGAKIVNARGAECFAATTAALAAPDTTIFAPVVLYPVSKGMRIYNEEQFGPIVPVCTYRDVVEVYDYLAQSPYGQQASVFGSDPAIVGQLIDVLVNEVSRVNVNCACQRGPDVLPFTGRKDSAYGTLSVHDALRVFSIRSLVASKSNAANQALVNQIVASKASKFLRIDYLF